MQTNIRVYPVRAYWDDLIGWLETCNIQEEYFDRTHVTREPSCFALHMIRIEQGSYLSAAASSAAARVETAEKPAEKKSLGAAGSEPQDRSCGRRARSAESGVEGKTLCERLVWVWRYRERYYKAKYHINTKAFLSIYSGVWEGKHPSSST